MRRADRLFQIIQVLRRSRRPVTAEALAGELEISKRTVYRDIASLIGQGVPVRGEAGVGYMLGAGYDLPPLMLTPDEIEAAVLGAQYVSARGDPALARAAEDLIAKIAAAVPERLRPYLMEPASGGPPPRLYHSDGLDIAQVRAWIYAGRKIRIRYGDEQERETERVIWPITIGYLDTARMLIAWCELRADFRTFRTDRVLAAEFLDVRHGERPGALRARWRRRLAEMRACEGDVRRKPAALSA